MGSQNLSLVQYKFVFIGQYYENLHCAVQDFLIVIDKGLNVTFVSLKFNKFIKFII